MFRAAAFAALLHCEHAVVPAPHLQPQRHACQAAGGKVLSRWHSVLYPERSDGMLSTALLLVVTALVVVPGPATAGVGVDWSDSLPGIIVKADLKGGPAAQRSGPRTRDFRIRWQSVVELHGHTSGSPPSQGEGDQIAYMDALVADGKMALTGQGHHGKGVPLLADRTLSAMLGPQWADCAPVVTPHTDMRNEHPVLQGKPPLPDDLSMSPFLSGSWSTAVEGGHLQPAVGGHAGTAVHSDLGIAEPSQPAAVQTVTTGFHALPPEITDSAKPAAVMHPVTTGYLTLTPGTINGVSASPSGSIQVRGKRPPAPLVPFGPFGPKGSPPPPPAPASVTLGAHYPTGEATMNIVMETKGWGSCTRSGAFSPGCSHSNGSILTLPGCGSQVQQHSLKWRSS